MSVRHLLQHRPAGDPLWSHVRLLLQCEGADGSGDIVDSGPLGLTVTRVGSPTLVSAHKPFGATSLYLNGTSQWLHVPNPAIGSNDYTIEWWARKTGAGPYDVVVSDDSGTGAADGILICNGTVWPWAYYQAGGSSSPGGYSAISSTWRHHAICSASGTVRWFLDGVEVMSRSHATGKTRTQRLAIGSDGLGHYWNGWLKGLRITRAARYTSNFTPPSGLYPEGPA